MEIFFKKSVIIILILWAIMLIASPVFSQAKDVPPVCTSVQVLNTTKTVCVARSDTAPVLNAVSQQWDTKAGQLLSIPLSVKDAEQDAFRMLGNVTGSKFSTVQFDSSGLPFIDFLWTPTTSQINKIYTVIFQAKETKTIQKLVSNKVSILIRVWPAGDKNFASITKVNVISSVFHEGQLVITGNVIFNNLLTAAERTEFITQKLELTIYDSHGMSWVSSTVLTLDMKGNWSVQLPVAHVPCHIILDFNGQKAVSTVLGCES